MKRTKRMNTKKKASAVMAAILIVALLLGGTFAWTDFSQSITNRIRGGADNDGLLHDDFEPDVNKDVYVENTGEGDLIVRVKFNEYLQIGNDPIIGTNPNDKSTWVTHLFEQSNPTDCGLVSHDYYTWIMSGNSKIYKPGTGEIGNETYTAGQTFADGSVAKETLPSNPPITMAEYIANKETYDAEANGRWILDSDGWAYWSKLLSSGDATNLLLDNVELNKKPDDNYFYAIDVILQVSNKTESYKLKTDSSGNKSVTDNGETLIDTLSGSSSENSTENVTVPTTEVPSTEVPTVPTTTAPSVSGISVTTLPDKTEYTVGDSFDKTGMVVTATMSDGSQKEITDYTISPETLDTEGEITITITANGKSDTITITVNPADTGLKFKDKYADDPTYTPPEDENFRIRFRQLSPRVYAYSTGANHEVGLPLSDILKGDTDGIKIARVRINNISRNVDLTDPQEIADYKVYIKDGKLAASFLPTYAELFKDFPNNTADEDNVWPFQVPVTITLSNADGSKTGDFTINVMFMGMATYNGAI